MMYTPIIIGYIQPVSTQPENTQMTALPYRLGLDLGSTSIGWCMVRLDKDANPCAIIRMGVRIFPDGRNPKDGTSLAVTRRLARQARRRRDRQLRRKARLIDALVRFGFFPRHRAARKALVTLDPYALRRRGLDEPLTGAEFARALFHLNQRRGFRSNRKTDRRDQETGLIRQAISDLRQQMETEGCRTVGEWLARRHARGESVRARLRGRTAREKAYDFYIDRSMIEEEFDRLWATQATFDPERFNTEAYDVLKDILLYQRPLKPVRPGRCTLIPEEERAPLALPASQRFRIYQELNHLRLIQPDFSERPLTLAERDRLADALEHRNLTFNQIRRLLGLPGHVRFNLEDGKRDRLKGNATSMALARRDRFGAAWHELDAERQEAIVLRLLDEPSETDLINWLENHAALSRAAALETARAGLPEGHGSLSRRALQRILPELRKAVITYDEAVRRAGFAHHSALDHLRSTGEILSALPYYGQALQRHVGFGSGEPGDPPEKRYGRIANPTVHIGLNELRKLVNALIQRYGPPREIVVEVARELKQSRQRRLEIQREQKRRQTENERFLREACAVLGLEPEHLAPSRRRELIHKLRLWAELNPDPANRRCPYTGEVISIERLLSDAVEIEHILPFSRTLDDSLNNKTVALRRANRDKGNRTPWEAFGERRLAGYDYPAILERAALMPRAKAWRFAPDGYQRWLRDEKDFLARSLNDTAYLSRIAREYLGLVCPQVRVIPGRLTAMLRGRFGLDALLAGKPGKNRNDHRHHALDAAVVAVTDQGLLQRFATASAQARERGLDRLVEAMPLPWPTYREQVARALQPIRVSFRPDHGYQGAMHQETAWGLRDGNTAVRRERPETGGPRQRRERRADNLISIRSSNDPDRHGRDAQGRPRPYKGYLGGSNHCIEIVVANNGRWKGEVVTTFQAYQLVREMGETDALARLRHPTRSLSGQPLVMRLMINDMLIMEVDGERRLLRVCKIRQDGRITLAPHNEANVDAREKDPHDPFRTITKTAVGLQKAGARAATVSVIGDLRVVRQR